MTEVAERAGVSRALVSIVMRDKPGASDSTRERVRAAAAELGYTPNAAAQMLARGRSDTIGVLLNDLHNPFFVDVTEGVESHAVQRGRQVLINSGWGRVAGEHDALERMIQLRLDGVVLGAPKLGLDEQQAFARRVPCVSVNTYGRPDGLDTVCNHERAGAQLAVGHLAELGHRRIAHIAADSASAGPERRAAFVAAIDEFGLIPVIADGDFTEESGYAAALDLLAGDSRPTAILATNDLSAVGVLAAAERLGLSVPDDVSVVGYDDTMLAAMRTVSLTSVGQPRHLIGERAAALLDERIAGRRRAEHVLIEPTLSIRRSTGPVPTGEVTP